MAHKKLKAAKRKQQSFKTDSDLKLFGYLFIQITNDASKIRVIRRFEFSKISESEIRIVKVEFRSGSQIRFRILRSKLIANSLMRTECILKSLYVLYTYFNLSVKMKYTNISLISLVHLCYYYFKIVSLFYNIYIYKQY